MSRDGSTLATLSDDDYMQSIRVHEWNFQEQTWSAHPSCQNTQEDNNNINPTISGTSGCTGAFSENALKMVVATLSSTRSGQYQIIVYE